MDAIFLETVIFQKLQNNKNKNTEDLLGLVFYGKWQVKQSNTKQSSQPTIQSFPYEYLFARENYRKKLSLALYSQSFHLSIFLLTVYVFTIAIAILNRIDSNPLHSIRVHSFCWMFANQNQPTPFSIVSYSFAP